YTTLFRSAITATTATTVAAGAVIAVAAAILIAAGRGGIVGRGRGVVGKRFARTLGLRGLHHAATPATAGRAGDVAVVGGLLRILVAGLGHRGGGDGGNGILGVITVPTVAVTAIELGLGALHDAAATAARRTRLGG